MLVVPEQPRLVSRQPLRQTLHSWLLPVELAVVPVRALVAVELVAIVRLMAAKRLAVEQPQNLQLLFQKVPPTPLRLELAEEPEQMVQTLFLAA